MDKQKSKDHPSAQSATLPMLNQSAPNNQAGTGIQHQSHDADYAMPGNQASYHYPEGSLLYTERLARSGNRDTDRGEVDQAATGTRLGFGGVVRAGAGGQETFNLLQHLASIRSEPDNEHVFEQSVQYYVGEAGQAIRPQSYFDLRNGHGLVNQDATGIQDGTSAQNDASLQHDDDTANRYGMGISDHGNTQFGTDTTRIHGDMSVRHNDQGVGCQLTGNVGDLDNYFHGPALDFTNDSTNASVWITELPTDCTLKDLFSSLVGCGKIFSASILATDRDDEPLAANVRFWNADGPKRLMEKAKAGLFIVKEEKPTIEMDRVSKESLMDCNDSRVINVRGRNTIANRVYMETRVPELCREVEDVIIWDVSGGWQSLQYRFASVEQGIKAKMALKRFKYAACPSHRERVGRTWLKIRYGRDPCEEALDG
ncbi:hypothetical protein ANO14919_039150 [Xylariales sp. No.14919]|nr:hypothetical protein ANO14919_039150 [Xylariales sp. No.14919]